MTALLWLALATVPDHAITPGVTNPAITSATSCSTKWGKDARMVTEAMKVYVAKAYGLDRKQIVGYGRGPCCEFDHLISRELGGADDVKNLWPQPWTAAKRKDQLENKLHRLTCAGTITLEEAQRAIATDWPAAYHRYIGPRARTP